MSEDDDRVRDDLHALSGAVDARWRVAWRVRATNATGHGDPLEWHLADAWVEWANKEFADIHHWIEPAWFTTSSPCAPVTIRNGS